ncbi:non-specific serine/threonine protein kinase OS=Tsukamurella paurometabola (strain ATCC 8368 / DSM / CCUG 35730 / CIP 100753 / JCM 10117 / KCTC 9821 / NBRC 16120 / NCIMB 702349 / NCTC 13040) OX=521096 GN=Tpau_0335 PE=4 SV=1 [Tsukamurella paurometabola]|uniref:non-specific serine/threonine protein kinase n=1 Tax=Tsukamurella paurometabola (strain ATCC 8368 / DSM 20162 / CCUG 35730 / CIP 100753 / JCM 10117 / KCTC 9821 / NBRC 16120 / NCIMB 702349 / NCTC 13040) TaxID=521096 RepID=D5URC5_TSUPD|nr:protein kinase [Tsukamurella paurometabola]ADG76978.1 serine/threonine protein kinase [Tsukamurella paurometabola DSM 20162]SUP42360.1 Serine/threonine-protein kinase pknF [Tsukamurella paurometabola]
MAEPGEVIAGYVVESVLGTGGMGTVYRVRHRTLPRSVALKVLQSQFSADPSVRARFDREADIVAGLKHPHIVDVYDRGESDGHLWIAMELVEGGNVAQIVQREGPFSLDRAVAVIEQVADALDEAHGHGILHRDVKPANFLVDRGRRGEQIKLADFGIGAAQTEVGQHTQTGTVVGTLAYTAPEALLGNPIDHRADIYSLACAAVVLLTGAPPFNTTISGQLMLAHISQNPPSIRVKRPDLSPEIDYVLGRAMAKNPADRYNSAGEFADALSSAARRMSGAAGIAPPPPPAGTNWQGTPSNPALATGFNPGAPAGYSGPPPGAAVPAQFYGGPSSPSNPSMVPPSPAKSRRPLIVGAAAAVVVLVAIAIGAFALTGGGASDGRPALDSWSARTVTDINGDTRINERPTRIVALGPGDAEIVTALGFDVVAGGNGPKSELPSWVPSLKEVPTAGTSTNPDRAAIEKAKPDLIIDTDPAGSAASKDLKSVANSIAVSPAGSKGWTWQEQMAYIAEALGAKDRASAVRKTYEQRITELRAAHPDFTGKKVDLVHYDGQATRLATNAASPFQLLGQLGFTMQVPAKGSGSSWLTVASVDLYAVVNTSSVDRTVVARTDPSAGNGGYDGLPAALTYGAPIVILDTGSGVDALLYGGPLAIDTVADDVIPAIAKGVK